MRAGEGPRVDHATQQGVGLALGKIYPPDAAADQLLDRLARQLRDLPWPPPKTNEEEAKP